MVTVDYPLVYGTMGELVWPVHTTLERHLMLTITFVLSGILGIVLGVKSINS